MRSLERLRVIYAHMQRLANNPEESPTVQAKARQRMAEIKEEARAVKSATGDVKPVIDTTLPVLEMYSKLIRLEGLK